jgi:MoaA/NifB/PqqE/SkfB family radical SAM enzyme
MSTSATFIATAANIHDLPGVAGLLNALGVKRLVVNEMHPEGEARSRSELVAEPSLVRDVIERVRENHSANELQLSFLPAAADDGPQSNRGGIWSRLTVTSDGHLKLCNQSVLTLGSIEHLSDATLDGLFDDLDAGWADIYRDRVDRCRCFDRMCGPAVYASEGVGSRASTR